MLADSARLLKGAGARSRAGSVARTRRGAIFEPQALLL